jgi:hypothetical protein
MQDDPRLIPGLTCHANAALIRLPHLCEATLIDISMHGALVWLQGIVDIKVGDEARLRVLTERGNHAFEVQALVAHRCERIVGLEISAIDQHSRGSLQRMIGINPDTPDLASRSLPVLLKSNLGASPMSA